MPCIITLKDALVTQTVDEDFAGMAMQLNLASASGKAFVVMDDVNGGHVLINMSQILKIEEEDS
jgi:hypothetical protein